MTLDILRMQRRLQDDDDSYEQGSLHREMVGLWRAWYDLKTTIIIGLMGLTFVILLGLAGMSVALVVSVLRLAAAIAGG